MDLSLNQKKKIISNHNKQPDTPATLKENHSFTYVHSQGERKIKYVQPFFHIM
jgi:hypothetical protein